MRNSLWSFFALTLLIVSPAWAADTARYILPPGNFGGAPFTVNSTDQLPLYSGLTPLRDNITPADIDHFYLPEDFQPIGATHEEATGRAGLQILYDSYGIAHIYGQTRADTAFGAGWVTARDRGLLLQVGRGPARVAVADVPNIDAFSLVTSLQTFVPERRGRSAGDAAGPAPEGCVRGGRGPADHRRRPGLRGRHQRVLGGEQHRPADRHGERRRRGDRVHRLDLRCRRRRRGGQLRPARQAPSAARRRPGLQGLVRRDAGRRSRSADDDRPAHSSIR